MSIGGAIPRVSKLISKDVGDETLIHRRSNLIPWDEDSNKFWMTDEELNSSHHYWEASPLLPFGMMFLLSTLVFLLILFRRWPSTIVGVISGCLSAIAIYLLFLTLRQHQPVYE